MFKPGGATARMAGDVLDRRLRRVFGVNMRRLEWENHVVLPSRLGLIDAYGDGLPAVAIIHTWSGLCGSNAAGGAHDFGESGDARDERRPTSE